MSKDSTYQQVYYETHREELLRQKRVYYQTHREELLRQKQVYWRENKEARQAYHQQYYRRNRARLLQEAKDNYHTHKDVIQRRRQDKRAQYQATENKRRAAKRAQFNLQRRQYRARHLEKMRDQDKKSYQQHRSQKIADRRRYALKYPDRVKARLSAYRARRKNAPRADLTAAQWREIKEAYGHRCVYCGRKMQRLTQDHITPLSRGGSHTVHNIVPACISCNSAKGAREPRIPIQPLLLTLAPSS